MINWSEENKSCGYETERWFIVVFDNEVRFAGPDLCGYSGYDFMETIEKSSDKRHINFYWWKTIRLPSGLVMFNHSRFEFWQGKERKVLRVKDLVISRDDVAEDADVFLEWIRDDLMERGGSRVQ